MRWCFFSPGSRTIDVLAGDSRTSGGAEAQIAFISAALSKAGHQISIIHGDGRASGDRSTISGITCIDAAPSWRIPGSIPRFWRALHECSPDMLYARLPSDFLWLMGAFAKLSPERRFLYNLAHDFHCKPRTAYTYKRWLHGPLYAMGLRTADAIAVQHSGQPGLLARNLQRKHIIRLPNLVARVSEAPRDPEKAEYDAVWIAMVRPEKRLEAFLDLASRLPTLKFAVAGSCDPDLDSEYRTRMQEGMKWLPNLSYVGALKRDEVQKLLVAAKVLVNTSSGEGFPNTMLEAWAAGVPVASLAVDPGGIIQSKDLGRVSGTISQLCADVAELARSRSLNLGAGSRGLEYVRSHHSYEAFSAAIAEAAAISPRANHSVEHSTRPERVLPE